MNQDCLWDIIHQIPSIAVARAHMGRLKYLDRSVETQEPCTNDLDIETVSTPFEKPYQNVVCYNRVSARPSLVAYAT